MPNLLAYALGLDPKSDKQHLLPKPLLTGADGAPPTSGESRFVALDLFLNPSATDITGIPEVSGDLMFWGAGEGDLQILDQSPTRLFFRDATAVENGQPGRFIRFRVGSP